MNNRHISHSVDGRPLYATVHHCTPLHATAHHCTVEVTLAAVESGAILLSRLQLAALVADVFFFCSETSNNMECRISEGLISETLLYQNILKEHP